MKTTDIKIGKKTFALAFTLDALAELEETIEGFSLADLAKYPRTAKGLGDLIYALAKQGELLQGRTLTVDRAWIGSHLSPAPARIAGYQVAVLEAINAGMDMETDDEEKGEEDVVLQELKKKDVRDE